MIVFLGGWVAIVEKIPKNVGENSSWMSQAAKKQSF